MTEENINATELLPIWKDNGLGNRIYKALHAYLDDYVFSPDEGPDHEPTEFERMLLEDFFNGAISDEAVNAILQEAARAIEASAGPENVDRWKGEEPPRDGAPFLGMDIYTMRWTPYSKKSEQYKRGIAGRWQRAGEHGGWENCPPPSAWRPSLPRTGKSSAENSRYASDGLRAWNLSHIAGASDD